MVIVSLCIFFSRLSVLLIFVLSIQINCKQNKITVPVDLQESTCEMKRSIEAKDRKITVLVEKVNSHFLLFDSIEKESFSIKRIVDNVQHVISEKEELGICFGR